MINFSTHKALRSLLIVFALLTAIGIVMVYSSSYIFAKESLGDSAYFFKKQLIVATLGLVAIFIVQSVNFGTLFKYFPAIHLIATFFLFCTFIPEFGVNIKGSRRWLDFGPFVIQPGEFIKYTIALFAINYFSHFNRMILKKKIVGLLNLMIPLALFIFQPDFGSFTICLIIISFVAFLSDFPRRYLYMGAALCTSGIILLIFEAPYRIQRLMSYLDPWQDPKKSGFQIIQSFLAFANGSFWGKGLGNSNEKLFYLPEAHNDFIFSVIGEELGFIWGVLPIVALFIAMTFLGFKIALALKSKTAAVTISTIIFAIAVQALLNMGVVLGLLPTKGLNLPFISYGGSSLLANLLAIGVIISSAKNSSPDQNPSDLSDFSSRKRAPYSYRIDYRSRVQK
ncbi:MAG: putative lipid II flippase FtsW [Bacteriovoracales bacterium]|nr:putative lipid II flippase FtsW [Bacteriovoracales bacterium]